MSTLWAAVAPSALMALCAAGSLVFGSALPTLPLLANRFFQRRLALLIGFSAGLMLATALHELFPAALEANPQQGMWGAAGGFLALYLAERLTHFHACRHRQCPPEEHLTHEHLAHEHDFEPKPHAPHRHAPNSHHAQGGVAADTMALTGMSIHNFADGLTMAVAFSVSQFVGLVVILAIVLHQIAVGLSLSAIMLRVGRSRRRVLLSATFSASFILLGALFFHLLPVVAGVRGIILGVAGGSFMYVAACDLLPEAHTADEGWGITAMTLAGYVFVLLLSLGE